MNILYITTTIKAVTILSKPKTITSMSSLYLEWSTVVYLDNIQTPTLANGLTTVYLFIVSSRLKLQVGPVDHNSSHYCVGGMTLGSLKKTSRHMSQST